MRGKRLNIPVICGAAYLSACGYAQAVDPQFVQPVPPMQPTFNPSYPNTVPQPPYKPSSPSGSTFAPRVSAPIVVPERTIAAPAHGHHRVRASHHQQHHGSAHAR